MTSHGPRGYAAIPILPESELKLVAALQYLFATQNAGV